jgi:phospholipid transport system substrate-binding protein
MTHLSRASVFLLLALTVPARGENLPPDALVKATIQELLDVVRQDRDIQAGNRRKVMALAEAKVLPHFDFVRMTRLAVGSFWRQATPEQRAQLEKEFRNLLLYTYVSALTDKSYGQYKDYKVEFEPFRMQPNDTEVAVRITVKRPAGPPIPVEYSMFKAPDGWKAYDVKVDGVSLVINYRASFANEIRQGGIEGLIQTLAQKNRTLNSQL